MDSTHFLQNILLKLLSTFISFTLFGDLLVFSSISKYSSFCFAVIILDFVYF